MLVPLLIEFIGTLLFLYVILSSNGDAISIGIILAGVILFGGKISGGNFNPAVSFMMYLGNKLDFSKMLFYIIAQLLGGTCALLLYTNRNSLSS